MDDVRAGLSTRRPRLDAAWRGRGPAAGARVRAAVLIASGTAGALAFPDTNWWVLAWGWLVPVLAWSLEGSPRAALTGGWLCGTAFFLVLLRWLDYTFQQFSAIPWPATWLPIVALAAYCGLYLGLACAIVAWLARRLGAGAALAVFPALWVSGEWVRGWLMDGFPWGLLAYSQHRILPVIQVAEIAGAWGVSFLIASGNAALAALLVLGPRRAAPGLIAAALLVAASLGFGWHARRAGNPKGPAVEVGIIQPSVAQSLRWDPARHAEILALYERLSREAARARPALILWPETATTIFLRGDAPLLARLTRLAADLDTAILVGSIDQRAVPDRGGVSSAYEFLNSAFLLTGQGITGKYDKIQLVPFGEYVPLSSLIGFVRGWAEFISDMGAGEAAWVLDIPGARFGSVICYEVIFPGLFRRFVAGGADFMANITNDAWFGETSGPWQHLSALPLRAVEHRVAIARAANTGVSAFIDPSGRIGPWLTLLERGVLTHQVPLRAGQTLYTRYGDWFVHACLTLSAVAVVAAWLRSSRRRDAE
jgi:apolipoprotein N-acyltransferase